MKPEYVKEGTAPGRTNDRCVIQSDRFWQPQATVSQGRDVQSAWAAGKIGLVLVAAESADHSTVSLVSFAAVT